MTSKVMCSKCNLANADEQLRFRGKPVCRICAHNLSHSWTFGSTEFGDKEIACPVTDGKGNVIPWGVYPNIDWS